MKHLLIIALFLGLLSPESIAQSGKKPVTVSFEVGGVCEMCKERIERTVDVKGVKSASYDLEHHLLTVTYVPSKVTEERLHQLLNDAGHDTSRSQASDAAYEKIHGCCRYREHEHNH